MNTRANIPVKWFILWVGLALAGSLLGCKSHPVSVESSGNVTKLRPSISNMTDSKRLSDGANKLLAAITKPTKSFHFSYQGEENINDKYLRDKTQVPQVGPVTLQADISSDELAITETRGQTKKEAKAKRGDEMNWAMANMILLGVMTNVNFSIAVGSTVTTSPSSDIVGTGTADKYTFDTTLASPSQKMGLDVARAMLTNVKDSRGTAWIAKDSGELVKFNIDTDYVDKNGHAWKEHYEGEVTPK